VTKFEGCSLQPNSGAAGEYTGLLAIKRYHESRKDFHRNICLIPTSAHGTNPASCILSGMKFIPVKTIDGLIDVENLKELAIKHKDNLAALMLTYPSTSGVFEGTVKEVIKVIHENGG
jgi:glycine dehydrogenase